MLISLHSNKNTLLLYGILPIIPAALLVCHYHPMGENSVVLEGTEWNLWREACSFVFFILSFLLLLHIFSFEHVKQAKRKFVCLYD